jgi:DNA-binding CsgD family transcriptional regulator
VKWLDHRDLKALHGFLSDNYRARDLPAFAQNVAATLPRIVPAEVGGYLTVNRQIPRVTWVTSPARVVPADRALERLVGELPVTSHRLRTGDTSALKVSDFVDGAHLRRLRLYNEFYRPLHVEHELGIALSVSPVSSISVALYRRTPDFSERDRLVLSVLRLHLVQVHEAARVITRVSHGPARAALGRTTGHEMVMIDGSGAIQRMSRRAHAWLTEHFGVRLPRMSLPEPLRLWIRHQEDALRSVAHELPVPRTPLILEGKETRLIIRLLSGAEESSVVVLERLQAAVRPVSLESRFALTEREAEVLAWVAQGKSNGEVASIVHARPRTIEKHLEHVYKKLGVENRFAAMLAVACESIAQLTS